MSLKMTSEEGKCLGLMNMDKNRIIYLYLLCINSKCMKIK